MAKQKTTQPKAAATPKEKATPVNAMPFGRNNYFVMISAVVLMAAGFIVMAMETEQYGFGFLGLDLGPVLLFLGFIVGVVSILLKPNDTTQG